MMANGIDSASDGVLLPLDSTTIQEKRVHIQEKRTSPDFEYAVLISSNEFAIKEMGPIKFPFNPEKKFRRIFEDIENTNSGHDITDKKIKAKGLALYDEIFPSQLKELYWQSRNKIRSIRVLSKEPWIPWEIVKPWRELHDGTIEEDEFLCEHFSFSRWIVDGPERIREHIKKVKIIIPSDTNLSKAIEERNWLLRFGNTRGLDVSLDSSYNVVKQTLETGGIDLLHFSTHGQSDNENPLLSAVELEQGIQLRPEDISGGSEKVRAVFALCNLECLSNWKYRIQPYGSTRMGNKISGGRGRRLYRYSMVDK